MGLGGHCKHFANSLEQRTLLGADALLSVRVKQAQGSTMITWVQMQCSALHRKGPKLLSTQHPNETRIDHNSARALGAAAVGWLLLCKDPHPFFDPEEASMSGAHALLMSTFSCWHWQCRSPTTDHFNMQNDIQELVGNVNVKGTRIADVLLFISQPSDMENGMLQAP